MLLEVSLLQKQRQRLARCASQHATTGIALPNHARRRLPPIQKSTTAWCHVCNHSVFWSISKCCAGLLDGVASILHDQAVYCTSCAAVHYHKLVVLHMGRTAVANCCAFKGQTVWPTVQVVATCQLVTTAVFVHSCLCTAKATWLYNAAACCPAGTQWASLGLCTAQLNAFVAL